jgi:ketosteroid isomerase-like protein
MSQDTRSELIDDYFRAVDGPDYDLLRTVFSDDVTYHYHEGESLRGLDDVASFLRDDVLEPPGVERTSDHQVTRTIAADDAVICEGEVDGEFNGTAFHTDFVDVFEFDDDDAQISMVATYTRG